MTSRGQQEVAGREVASRGRDVSIGRLPETSGQLSGREQLEKAWTDPGRRVVSLVAWGGGGSRGRCLFPTLLI